jgi:hypothetical protein
VLPQLLLRLIRRQHHQVGSEQGDKVGAILGLNLPGTPEVVGVAVQQFRGGGQRLEGVCAICGPADLGRATKCPLTSQPGISGRVDRARKHLQDYVEFGAVQALKLLGDSLDD